MFRILIILLTVFVALGCNLNSTEKKNSQKPNIIFIMDDQHRWNALGKINPTVITPTLDGLAEEGVFFDQAVCQAPMCTPSRNSMMFGLYPNQTGVYSNGKGIPDSLLPGKTIAQYFKDAGYETVGFGKTHWGGRQRYNTRGFETRYVSEIKEKGAVSMAEMNPEAKKRYDAEIKVMGSGEENNIGYLGFTSKLKEEDHRDGWITQQAIKYIDQRKDNRPLFFYLSYMKPHAGHNVPEGFEERYDLDSISYAQQPNWTKDYSPHAEGVNRRDLYENYWKNASETEWKLMTMRYYANITWIDDMMGRVLKKLEKKGLLENTIIVYTSDHGEMLGDRFYRFNKYNLYDGSVKIPMILAGSALPKSIQKNSIDSSPTENIDLLPTLLYAADIAPERSLPGINLLGSESRAASFSALHERAGEAAFMWRNASHKLILVFKRKKNANDYSDQDILTGELYDLKNDPQEWTDLFNDQDFQNTKKEMSTALLNHLKNMRID
jgi:arylsulfatase A-like enzyme